MKKIILFVIMLLVITGCGKSSEKDVVKSFADKLNKNSGYYIKGDLSINNNDDVYNYTVEVYHMKNDFYKVSLINKANEHEQIILKNKDGVYVLTPSLNKSFRFQSDWPYKNSQIYLLDALLRDIQNDKDYTVVSKNSKYVLDTSVSYPNNKKLVKQRITFNKNAKPSQVSVYDKDGIEVMSIKFNSIDYSLNLSENDFDIDNIIDSSSVDEEVETTNNSLEDIVYPLYLPSGTKLIDEEVVSKVNGERVIMNYDGEKSFILVEETADVFNEFTVIPSFGEPFQLLDTLGVMTDNSLSWTTGGVDFYLVSDVISHDEMVEVAQSITGIISMK